MSTGTIVLLALIVGAILFLLACAAIGAWLGRHDSDANRDAARQVWRE